MADCYTFESFEVRPAERRLLVNGEPAAVGARAFDLLVALIEHRDRIVSKDELLDLVWPDVFVEENNLQVHVSSLRKYLGRDAIATVPGRGYRFTAPLNGEREAPARSSLLDSAATNIGLSLETLIGRSVDLDAIARLLGERRLVTIVGPGGIGKTRLAREAALGMLNSFKHGVWCADLANLPGGSIVSPAIAAAARIKLGTGEPTAMLALALARHDMLLLLDNCEHVVSEVAATVSEILSTAPQVRIVATSQLPLRVRGETLYRLEPLALPEHDGSLQKALEFPALQLFERRARTIDRRFRLTEDTVDLAVSICRALDGLPLAIEMAAARAPVLGLATLSSRLGERLRLLRSGERHADGRHASLRATLDWTYSLLHANDQAVLRRLGVFSGSFRLDTAQKLCADGRIDPWHVLDALDSLVDASLVQVIPGPAARYRLLETTRLYALERLAQHGELETVRSRHGAAMAWLAQEIVGSFRCEPEPACLRRYLPDADDLSAAFERATASFDCDVAAWAGEALTRLDLASGIYSSMRHRKEAAHRLLTLAEGETKARLWTCVAFSRYTAFPPAPKLVANHAEIDAWRAVGGRENLYEALCRYATACASAGEFAGAEAALEEAERLEGGDWPPQLRIVRANNAANAAAFGNDAAEFARLARQQGVLAEEAGSLRLAATARQFAAEAALNSGHPDRALRLVNELVEGSKLHAHAQGLGYPVASSTMGQALLELGRDDEAARVGLEALPSAIGNGVGGWILDALALVAVRRRLAAESATLLGYADACYSAVNEIRRMQDRRCAQEAEAAAIRVLGPAFEALRAEARRLLPETLAPLAKDVAKRLIKDS